MRYLLSVIENYRVDTVEEVLEMRDEMAAANCYDLQSFQYTTKFDKKTEEDYQVVKAKKFVNNEKEPTCGVQVKYEY